MGASNRWLPLLLPLSAGLASAGITWNRWITPFVDSSREMQVPARLASGERLYRDVVYHYGPVGPWCGALLLKIFGNRWSVLQAMCALTSAVLFFAMYRLTRTAGSRLSATAAVTAGAALCLGAPLGGAFLFPYSIDYLVALASGAAVLALVSGPPFRLRGALGSVALGICLASRVEIGLPTLLLVVISDVWSERDRRQGGLRIAAGGLALGIAIYAFAFGGLSAGDLFPEGPGAVLSPPAEWLNVYRLVSGLDAPLEGLTRVVTSLALLGVALAGAWSFRKGPGPILWQALVVLAAFSFFSPVGTLIDANWPPLLAAAPAAAILFTLGMLRKRLSSVARARFLLFGYSALVGSRVFLRLAYSQESTPYSVFALPALFAASAVILIDLPSRFVESTTAFRRNVAAVFFGVACVGLFRLARISLPRRSLPISTPAGALRLPPLQAVPTRMTLQFLEREARPGDRLAGFPEAGIFNFALGLENPLREEQNLPGNLTPADENRVIGRLLRTQPRFVLLVNQPVSPFGRIAFGEDYDRKLWAAVLASYSPAASFGTSDIAARIGSKPFFIRVYERRASGPFQRP
ncbi:MAG: hypothetical protein ACRD16_17190 [Thermoanaerobaculia bacterium]